MYTKTNLPQPASTPVAVQLSESIANNAGIIDISEGQIIEMWPMPKSTNVLVTNPNNANSGPVIAFIFNENSLKNTLLDNVYPEGAVDADKPTVVYNDGFKGRLINSIIAGLNGGRGLMCKELTIIGRDAAGNQTDAAILLLDAAIQSYNAVRGTPAPINVDLGEAIRVSAFKNGMVTVKLKFWVNLLTQFAFNCPKGYTYELKFKWDV